MSPVTHILTGWLLTFPHKPNLLTRPEKTLVVMAAVIPDIDGLGIVPELLTRKSSHPILWYSQYHHSLHTLAFAVVCAATAFLISRSAAGPAAKPHQPLTHPWLTAGLAFISFHLHLLCDLTGARGPDGYQWPIPYLKPFSNAVQLSWQGQWALNGWQNIAFTALLLLATFWLAWNHSTSPLELFSAQANRAFVHSLRNRFPVESKKCI